MSPDNPYNSLGQIMAKGGEVALGLAMVRGWDETQISSLFSRRFEPLRDEDRAELRRFSARGVDAAQRIQDRQRQRLMGAIEDSIDRTTFMEPGEGFSDLGLEGIPINPNLFGGELDGRRARYVGILTDDEGKDILTVYGDLADLGSPWEIHDAVRDRAKEMIDDSPKAFGGMNAEDVDAADIRVVFIERAF